MTKVKGTHADATDFDGPVDTGDAQGKRPADKKKNGQGEFDAEAINKSEHPSGKVSTFPSGKVAEEVSKLFDGVEGLTEGFAEKAGVLVEGVLSEQVATLREEFEAEYTAKLDEEVEAIQTTLEEALDNYLTLVVENFIKENTVALEEGIKNDIAEQVIESMVAIVENAGVELPEDKIDIAEALATQNAELEENYNTSLHENIELRKAIRQYEIKEAFDENTAGLSEASRDKLRKLTENVAFETTEQYVEKLNVLKESITETAPRNRATLTEEVVEDAPKVVNSRMSAYLAAARDANH